MYEFRQIKTMWNVCIYKVRPYCLMSVIRKNPHNNIFEQGSPKFSVIDASTPVR